MSRRGASDIREQWNNHRGIDRPVRHRIFRCDLARDLAHLGLRLSESNAVAQAPEPADRVAVAMFVLRDCAGREWIPFARKRFPKLGGPVRDWKAETRRHHSQDGVFLAVDQQTFAEHIWRAAEFFAESNPDLPF